MNRLLSNPNRLPDPGAGFAWRVHNPTVALHPRTADSRAAFTTRIGGVGPPPLDGLNLSWTAARRLGINGGCGTGLDELILANRAIAARTIVPDWPASRAERWSLVRQVHGGEVRRASSSYREGDALWTDEPDRLIAVLVADCVPVVVAVPGRVAILHCGWRGMAGGIIDRGVREAGATAAAVGPGIGPCCYEVGEEVLARFWPLGPEVALGRRLDLRVVARRLLERAGVEAIEVSELCTSCESELFFSHRRDGERTGRQAGLVWREPEHS